MKTVIGKVVILEDAVGALLRESQIGVRHQERREGQRVRDDEQPHSELLGANRIRRLASLPD